MPCRYWHCWLLDTVLLVCHYHLLQLLLSVDLKCQLCVLTVHLCTHCCHVDVCMIAIILCVFGVSVTVMYLCCTLLWLGLYFMVALCSSHEINYCHFFVHLDFIQTLAELYILTHYNSRLTEIFSVISCVLFEKLTQGCRFANISYLETGKKLWYFIWHTNRIAP